MKRSALCNIEVLKSYKDTYLLEYTPYGAIEDGNPNKRLYATVWDYDGEETWDKGGIIDASYESAVHTFYHYAKVGIEKVKVKFDSLNISNDRVIGYCLVYSKDDCVDEYKFIYYPDKKKVKILFKSSDTYTEPERDSAEEFLLEELNTVDFKSSILKKYNVDLIKSQLESELKKYFDKTGEEDMNDPEMSGIEFKFEDKYLIFTVYAEVDYSALEEICDTLDKVIVKYNRDAYFEPETSGRAVCYLS